MFNIALEVLRAVVLLGLVAFLWEAGRRRFWLARNEWRIVIGGFGLLLFGSLLDITDDFPALGRFVAIGDTRVQSFLEVVVGFLGGTLVLATGLVLWRSGGRRAADDCAPYGPRQEALNDACDTLEPGLQGPKVELQTADAGRLADITEPVLAGKAIGVSEGHFMAVVDNAPSAIFLKDMEGRYRFVNKRFQQWYGVSALQARGLTSRHILPQDSAESCVAQDREALETGTAVSREQTIPFSDGTVHLVYTAKFPVSDSEGRLVGVGGIGTELTELKDSEAALLAAKAEAELASRAKSEFLANMSHELRAPLDAIIGFSEIIEGETLGPVGAAQYRDYAREIAGSGRRLLKHINNMLDLSRIEAGKVELCEEDVDVAEAIRSALLLAGGRAHQGGVALEQDTPEDLPRLRVDERMLRQILVDLLSNAVKFTPAGGTVKVGARAGHRDAFVLWISDTGIGMGLENIPRAMVRLGQIDSELRRKFEGSGLGLPLTKSLVELHGGMMDLDSELGVGTTVTIRFPAARVVRPPKGMAMKVDTAASRGRG